MTNKSQTPYPSHSTNDTSNLKDQADQTAEQIKEQMSSVATQAKETVIEVANDVKSEASSKLEDVKHQAFVAAEEQKDRTADRLNGVISTLRQSSQQFRSQEDEAFAWYADAAADQVENFTSYLESKDVGELLSNVHDFARRQPEIFVAGALTAGFFLGRFFKSSQSNGDRQRGGYGSNLQAQYVDPTQSHRRTFDSRVNVYNGQRSATNPDSVSPTSTNKPDWANGPVRSA